MIWSELICLQIILLYSFVSDFNVIPGRCGNFWGNFALPFLLATCK